MAQGVPVVATTAGAEGLDPGALDTVLVADTARGLADHVAAVLTEPLLWERLAKGGQALVADRFSPGAARPAWSGSWATSFRIRWTAPTPPPGTDLALPSPAGPGHARPPIEAPSAAPRQGSIPNRCGSPRSSRRSRRCPWKDPGCRCRRVPPGLGDRVHAQREPGDRRDARVALRQDFPAEAFEILIVDNASTDATPEVVGAIARQSSRADPARLRARARTLEGPEPRDPGIAWRRDRLHRRRCQGESPLAPGPHRHV